MAVTRRGRRPIVFDQTAYYWSVRFSDDLGLRLVVCGEAAFVSGQRGQLLLAELGSHHRAAAGPTGHRLHQRTVVTPGVVRRVIEAGQAAAPSFTGGAGLADVHLSLAQVRQAAGLTAEGLLDIDLAAATASLPLLTQPERRNDFFACWYWVDAHLHRSADVAASEAAVGDWMRQHGAALMAAQAELQRYVDEWVAVLRGSPPVWGLDPEPVEQMRSSVRRLLAAARRHGVPLDLVTEELDALPVRP